MRADWTASGAFTSGSTAHPRGATRRASGCAATTSTTSAERSRGCRGATAGLEISRGEGVEPPAGCAERRAAQAADGADRKGLRVRGDQTGSEDNHVTWRAGGAELTARPGFRARPPLNSIVESLKALPPGPPPPPRTPAGQSPGPP